MRNGLDLRRKLLKRSIAAPAAGLCSRLSWTLAGTEPALLNVAPGLIGYGVAGKRFVNQFRTRYPELARRTNTLTVIFPADEEVPVEREEIKVANAIDRLFIVVGLGEPSGRRAAAAIRGLVDEHQIPFAEFPPDVGVANQVHACCLGIRPYEVAMPVFAEALEQERDLRALPDLPIMILTPEHAHLYDDQSRTRKGYWEGLDRYVPEMIAMNFSAQKFIPF